MGALFRRRTPFARNGDELPATAPPSKVSIHPPGIGAHRRALLRRNRRDNAGIGRNGRLSLRGGANPRVHRHRRRFAQTQKGRG